MKTDEIAEAAIALYIEWINMWCEADKDNNYRYTREEYEEFSTGILNVTDSGWHKIYVISLNNGDEGGGEVLTAWVTDWREMGFTDRAPFHIAAIVQDFDTMVQFIYNAEVANGWVNTP